MVARDALALLQQRLEFGADGVLVPVQHAQGRVGLVDVEERRPLLATGLPREDGVDAALDGGLRHRVSW